MSKYTVTASNNGFIVSVHHEISADSEKAAIDIAKMYHPPRAKLTFRAEKN